jgi:hypothetical protein
MLVVTCVGNVANVFVIIGRGVNCLDACSRQKWKKHMTEQSKNLWKHTPSEFPIFQLKGGKNWKQDLIGAACLIFGQTKQCLQARKP